MRRDIWRRIERLEQAAGTSTKPLPDLFFHFTDKQTSTNAIRGWSDGRDWQREPDEAEDNFKARVVGDLEVAHVRPPFLVMLFDT